MLTRNVILDVFKKTCDAVQPTARIPKVLSIGDKLIVKTDEQMVEVGLDKESKVVVYSFGKASIGMMESVRNILDNRIDHSIVIAPISQKWMTSSSPGCSVFFGGENNLPDENSVAATEFLIDDLRKNDSSNTVFLFLISGGGSALFSAPEAEITLEQKLAVIRQLVSKGASINTLNIVRQAMSKVKGGKTLNLVTKAKVVTLILSDIVGDPVELIASGPTVQNDISLCQVEKILKENEVEVPVLKVSEKKSTTAENIVISSNKVALSEAKKQLEALGVPTIIVTSSLEGNATEIGRAFADVITADRKSLKEKITRLVGKNFPTVPAGPVALLFGGETTVLLKGNGKGGRNQEMVLACLDSLKEHAKQREFIFASIGTDGQDGPTDAAGAMITHEDVGANTEDYLQRNDSYNFWTNYKNSTCHVKTGPTGTNVMDIQFLLLSS